MTNNDYLRQIHQLIELQKVDDEIFAVKKKMESAPRKLTEQEQKFKTIDGRRTHILDKLTHLNEQKKRLSIEIEDDSSKIKKSKNKLMQVGNTREYQAMLREMDSIEKINRTREEDKITLLEELRIQNENLEEIDKEYEEVKQDLEKKRQTLDATLETAAAQLEKLNRKRKDTSQDIPLPIFMRYEFIRERLEHPVIVSAEDGICSGCHIAIPPQTFIELQMGQQILSCPNCQRLIFWSQHSDEPAAHRPAPRPPRVEAGEEKIEEEDLTPDEEAEDADLPGQDEDDLEEADREEDLDKYFDSADGESR